MKQLSFILIVGVLTSARLFAAADFAWRPTVLLTLPDISLERGQSVELPVHVAQSGEYFGLQLALRFNPELVVVEAVEARATADMGEFMHAARPDGRVALSWFDAVPHRLDATTPLFVVRVRALANTALREAVMMIPDGLRPEIYTAEKETRKLELGFAAGTSVADQKLKLVVGLPQPNPTAAGAALFVFLPEARTVTFELTDGAGRLVHRFEQNLDAGTQRLEIPTEAFPGAGVYAWRIVTGEESVSGKVVRQ